MLRAAINILIAGLFVLHSLQWIAIPGIVALNNVAHDHLIRTAPRANEVIEDIVVMDIDEASLSNEKLGRWPWSRNVLSNLIIQLFEEHEVRVVAFDVVFSEADKSSGLEQLEKLAVGPFAGDNAFRKKLEELTPTLQYDELFAEVLMQYPVVLGYYFNTEGSIRSGVLPLPTVLKEENKIQPGGIVKATGYGANIQTLSDAAIASGHFNPIVDEDGLIRRVPLLLDFAGELYESLALATFRVAKAVEIAKRDNGIFKVPALQLFDTTGKEILSTSPGTASPGAVQIAEKVIPTKDDGTIYVSYQGKAKTFRYISFNDLVNNRVDKEMLRDKIILVGTTAPGLSDFRSTPMGELYPGVEVHANALASMLSKDGLSVPTQLPEQKVLEIVALLVAAAFLITVLPRLSPLMSVAVWLVVVAVEAGATYHLWVENHIVVSFGPLIAMTVFLFLWSFGYQFYSTFKNKNQFASLFGQYVPPELVKKMAEDPTKYSMQGKRAELTVMFSDVRGFTTISESLSAQELSEFINLYLTTMSRIVRQQDGTLDKYIGDCIMAFWGAPIENSKHAMSAVSTALSMEEALQGMNQICLDRHWPTISIGIGLNTGHMSVGDMGSEVRKAYTVMGDAVNLASRLEGLTKHYGVVTLVSEHTAKQCPNIVFRDVDLVTVKGKTEPVAVLEPIADRAKISDEQMRFLDYSNNLLDLYRARRFSEITSMRADCSSKFSESFCKKLDWLHDQASEFIGNPPPEDWCGVNVFMTK